MDSSSSPAPTPQQRAFVWWVIWFAILSGATLIYVMLGLRGGRTPAVASSPLAFVGVGPIVISLLLRWFIMPKVTDRRRGLPIFVTGLALAEGATIIATFLGTGETRDAIAVLGIVTVAMWAPVFAADIIAAERR